MKPSLLIIAFLLVQPSLAGATKPCLDSSNCSGDDLCRQSQCTPRATVSTVCSNAKACPKKGYGHVYEGLDLFCAGKLDAAALNRLSAAVVAGHVERNSLRLVYNLTGAMSGYQFTKLPQLNAFYYGTSRKPATWLPSSCTKLIRSFKSAKVVPRIYATQRERVKKAWRASKPGALVTKPTAAPALVKVLRNCEWPGLDGSNPLAAGVLEAGPSATIALARKGKTRYLLTAPNANADIDSCRVYQLPKKGRLWAKRSLGRFLASGKTLSATALSPEFCGNEQCEPLVVLTDRSGAVRWAHQVVDGTGCSEGLNMEPLKLFRAADSLQLRCRSSMGAAWREELSIIHFANGAFRSMFSFSTGVREYLTLDEKKEGMCPSRPGGWLKVKTRGVRPVIRVFDVDKGAELAEKRGLAGDDDTKAFGLLLDLQWDPKAKKFKPVGPGKLKKYKARKCK